MSDVNNHSDQSLSSPDRRKVLVSAAAIATVALAGHGVAYAAGPDMSRGADNFYQSKDVDSQEVRYKNALGLEVVGTLFTPKRLDQSKKHPALVVGHPYGAVRQRRRICTPPRWPSRVLSP
ncbi:alpha/beta hydrolase [Pigmentiphaga aceris]|uniref:alpha/beta hydrolase n=1 Tax=Pigmentiphaga aceris TaxID=1940612 RepID=UPI001FEC143F|nr:alpha/beta hydrolase [Pigmentiphaga aceris]